MLLSLRPRASARGRLAAVGAVTAVLSVMPTGVAHAEAPTNDDFDHATPVAALPFTARQDTSAATKSPDDPYGCQSHNAEGGVWFHHTATADGFLRATTADSDHPTILSAYTGERGELWAVDDACGVGNSARVTFQATAGTTYHFLAQGHDTPGGALTFTLDVVPAAPNDAFADAEPVSTLPLTREADLSIATFEADEPGSSCDQNATSPSVWYTYTTPGPAISVTARVEDHGTAVTVYTGSNIADLTEVACETHAYYDSAVFRASPGTTYHIRVTGPSRSQQPTTLRLAEAPPLQPQIDQSPSEPSIYDVVRFSASSWNAIDRPITTEWDFGDGTTSEVGTEAVSHRYTADGAYPVTLRATSPDGRAVTKTITVEVQTHDVAITRFDVPSSAREGATKPITVHVANTRYPETATVVLSKHDGTFWREVGSLTLDVPARPNRKAQFPFAYTFTPDDARVGKVAFRAVVTLPYPVRDARPADNEVVAIATTVTPSATPVGAE